MVCDLYAVIDRNLSFGGHFDERAVASDFAADLVSVLPPRGHAFHDLTILQRTYRTPDSAKTQL